MSLDASEPGAIALLQVLEGQGVARMGDAAAGKEGFRPSGDYSLANSIFAVRQYLTNDKACGFVDQADDITDPDRCRLSRACHASLRQVATCSRRESYRQSCRARGRRWLMRHSLHYAPWSALPRAP